MLIYTYITSQISIFFTWI